MKPIIVFERENTLKVTKVSELPSPNINSEAWKKVVEEAEAGKRATYKYHIKKGVKY